MSNKNLPPSSVPTSPNSNKPKLGNYFVSRKIPTEPIETNSSNYVTEIIVDSACDSTTHGIPHFFKRKNWILRIMWAVCFFISTGICFYMIAQTILTYLEYDTVTRAQRIYQVSAEFPTVSICNINPFVTNASYEYVKTVLVRNGMINPFAPEAIFNYIFDDTLQNFKFTAMINAFTGNMNDSVRKTFGYDFKDMLLSCTFNLKNCTENDFDWYYDLYYGNCFKFNSGKNLNIFYT